MIALIILSFTSILVFFIVSKIQKATEDTATPDESSEGVCKLQSPKGLFSTFAETVFFGLLHLVFGLVFCSLWFLWVWVYWGREKREKEKSAVILRSASFSFSFLSVALYTIERVLLSDAPSPLPLSPCSLSDPTSTSI